MQERLNEKQLKPKDVPTRLNSTCDMFEKILKIKDSLLSTLAIEYKETQILSSEDIAVLENTVQILSFLKDMIEEISSEKNVTISEHKVKVLEKDSIYVQMQRSENPKKLFVANTLLHYVVPAIKISIIFCLYLKR